MNVKQDYFYTISENISFPSFWDEYFIDYNYILSFKNEIQLFNNNNNNETNINLMNKNLVLITSKIIVSDIKLSYASVRSIYSCDERFEQTIQTIHSVRKFIPNSYIVLFDNSDLDPKKTKTLHSLVDIFMNIKNNKLLNYYTDSTDSKLLSELIQCIFFYIFFLKNINLKTINHFFKISGRYLINNSFEYNHFNNNQNIFKLNNKVRDRQYYYTSFYKLNNTTIKTFFKNFKNIFQNKHQYKYCDYECIIPNIIKDDITLFKGIMGITQIYSCFKVIDFI
jgi:hypothetical protein